MTRSLRITAAFCALLLGVVACGGGDGPAGTTGGTLASLRISGSATATAGDTVRFTLAGLDSKGASVEPTGVLWSSSDAAGLSLSTGSATAAAFIAVRAGSYTVHASAGGVSTDAPLSVAAPAKLVADNDSLVLTALGASAILTAKLNGATVAPTATLLSERRYLGEAAVLRLDVAGQVTAAAPGTATLALSYPRAAPDTITVIVRPATPAVVSARGSAVGVGTGDTIIVRGYRLNTLPDGAATLDGAPLARLSADSATLRLAATTASGGPCNGNAGSTFTVLTGGPAFTSTIARKRAGEIVLGVGEARVLADSETACLRFAANADSARYLVAFADLRGIEASKTTHQPYVSPYAAFQVTFGSGASAAATRTTAAAPARRTDYARPMSAAGSASYDVNNPWLYTRTAPWQVGDTTTFVASATQQDLMRVAVRSPSGYFVFFVSDTVAYASHRAVIDSALAFMDSTIVPMYQQVLWPGKPIMTAATPQLLIFGYFAPGSLDGASGAAAPGRAWVQLGGMQGGLTTPGFLKASIHEVLHIWDSYRTAQKEAAGFGASDSRLWNDEGMAEFFTYEGLRRWSHHSFTDNLSINNAADGAAGWYRQAEAGNNPGTLDRGYQPAGAFARDVIWSLMQEKNLDYDAAMRVVAPAMLDGWYGCAPAYEFPTYGCSAEGVAEVMSRVLGRAWDPAEAITDWTLAEAVDDGFSSQRYRIPSFTGMSYLVDTFNPNGPNPVGKWNGGGSISGTIEPESAGFADVRVGSMGASIPTTATAPLRWKVLRIR